MAGTNFPINSYVYQLLANNFAMYLPPKRNLGGKPLLFGALPPKYRIMLRYVLVFQTGLRRDNFRRHISQLGIVGQQISDLAFSKRKALLHYLKSSI